MKELSRTFFYSNGYQFKIERVAELFEDTQNGKILIVTVDGEKFVVVPGWVATGFKPAPPPALSEEALKTALENARTLFKKDVIEASDAAS